VKEWREKKHVFVVFLFDLEGLGPLPTYPLKKRDQNHCSSLLQIIFRVFENSFKKGREASRHRIMKELKLFAFN